MVRTKIKQKIKCMYHMLIKSTILYMKEQKYTYIYDILLYKNMK